MSASVSRPGFWQHDTVAAALGNAAAVRDPVTMQPTAGDTAGSCAEFAVTMAYNAADV